MDARSVICLQNYEFLWASVLHPQRITLGVFYKLRDKERSKESAYVLFWSTPCSVVYGTLSTLYVNKGGNKKTLQTIHKPDIQPCIPLTFRALRNV